MNERILAGRYCLLDAVGGRADLFHARDESLQRKVAVKRLRETMPGMNRQQWEQEIAKAAGLHDPHLLAIYDVVVEEDCFYLITEDLEGDILARWMRRSAPLSPKKTIDVMRQLTSAVVQAEKNGLREITIDANSVLVTREGFVKVIEYGPLLGSNYNRQTHQDLLRTAGELMYEMLTGSSYSDFLPTREVVEEIHRALQQVSVEHGWLPDRVEQMVQRALGLLEGRTYLSIQDLYKDLKAVHHALGQRVDSIAPAKQEAAAVTEPAPKLGRVKESVKNAAQGSVNKVAQLRNMEIVKKITEQNKPKMTKRTPLTILWAVLALVVVSGGLWYMLGEDRSSAQTSTAQTTGKTVQMPNLVNKTDAEALQILTADGVPKDQILWVYRPADDTKTEPGKVYMQSVDPNQSVTVGGSKIILTVNGSDDGSATNPSAGDSSQQQTTDSGDANQQVTPGTVPNVRGMSVDQAGALLIKAGYHYDFRVVAGGDTPSGTVFKQDPDGGGQAASGTHIHLLVSQ